MRLDGVNAMLRDRLKDAEQRLAQAQQDIETTKQAQAAWAEIEAAGGMVWDAATHQYVPRQ